MITLSVVIMFWGVGDRHGARVYRDTFTEDMRVGKIKEEVKRITGQSRRHFFLERAVPWPTAPGVGRWWYMAHRSRIGWNLTATEKRQGEVTLVIKVKATPRLRV